MIVSLMFLVQGGKSEAVNEVQFRFGAIVFSRMKVRWLVRLNDYGG